MKKSITKIIAAIFILSFLPNAHAEVVDRVMAVVGGNIITLSDVKHYSAERSANSKFAKLDTPDLPETKDPLESLIREKILTAEIEHLGITATDAEVTGTIQELIRRSKLSSDKFKSEVTRKGITWDQYKKQVGEQIKQMKFLSQVIFPRIKIGEDELSKKAGSKPTEEARIHARMELMQARSSEELAKYLDEARAKTYVEIKK